MALSSGYVVKLHGGLGYPVPALTRHIFRGGDGEKIVIDLSITVAII